ncbi:histidine phosphatase family protein [Aquabacter spiritensis]|uniref:Putative phosphoglycerate mutase n=1 Tax=Aquabacter spiritensis TaxID=933073 RepID=A0A4R3LUV9_9HYPH|nr:histidine phosphatase family protein [Aquabacter spiritensis]TCT04321.1 putative phosphoglycerate mutase [Aquabacter spiritensis]
MTTTTLILARHGHVEGIHPERFRGRMEVPLSARGERQAAALAARIAAGFTPAAVYTSDLGRCIATGAAISQACGIPAEIAPGLGDIDYGAWQWKTHDEVRANDPERYAQWRTAPHLVRFPEGESLQDVAVRAADLLRLVLARHSGASVVLVGHDSVNRVLLGHLLDLPAALYWRLAQDPCNLTLLEWSGDAAKLVRLNDVSHLDGI